MFFPKYLTLLKLLIQHTKKFFKPFYPLITKHNNTKTQSNLLKLREKISKENLVKFTKDQT